MLRSLVGSEMCIRDSITYLSEELMDMRFGRRFQDEESKVDQKVNFEVENYLQYKGEKFSESFDANSYILMTKAMDGYDAGKDRNLEEAMENIKAELLIVGFYSDWLYPAERGKEIQIAGMNNNIKASFPLEYMASRKATFKNCRLKFIT